MNPPDGILPYRAGARWRETPKFTCRQPNGRSIA